MPHAGSPNERHLVWRGRAASVLTSTARMTCPLSRSRGHMLGLLDVRNFTPATVEAYRSFGAAAFGKTMNTSLKLLLIPALLSLAAGSAAADMTCAANVPVTPTLRTEGYTERTGDITVGCTGGAVLT